MKYVVYYLTNPYDNDICYKGDLVDEALKCEKGCGIIAPISLKSTLSELGCVEATDIKKDSIIWIMLNEYRRFVND